MCWNEGGFHQGCVVFFAKDYNLDPKKWKGFTRMG